MDSNNSSMPKSNRQLLDLSINSSDGDHQIGSSSSVQRPLSSSAKLKKSNRMIRRRIPYCRPNFQQLDNILGQLNHLVPARSSALHSLHDNKEDVDDDAVVNLLEDTVHYLKSLQDIDTLEQTCLDDESFLGSTLDSTFGDSGVSGLFDATINTSQEDEEVQNYNDTDIDDDVVVSTSEKNDSIITEVFSSAAIEDLTNSLVMFGSSIE